MKSALNQENEPQGLPAEIEELRIRFEDTQELYREVCALLFFRHGITPTANRLYQLVRRGSMSAPAKALNDFWKTVREKSRLRVAHPELPPELGAAAGELIGKLWTQARTAAEAELEVVRAESAAALAALTAEKDEALARLAAMEARLLATEAALTELQTREQSLTEAAATAHASRLRAEAEVAHTHALVEELRRREEAQKETQARALEELRTERAGLVARHTEELTQVGRELATAREDAASWRTRHEQATLDAARQNGLQLVHLTRLEAELAACKQKLAVQEAELASRHEIAPQKPRLGASLVKRR